MRRPLALGSMLLLLVAASCGSSTAPGFGSERPMGEAVPSELPQPETAETPIDVSTENPPPIAAGMDIIAESKRRFTGVAVTGDEQVFVNFPRWSNDVPVSVGLYPPPPRPLDVTPQAFPSKDWNDWKAGVDPKSKWVCVQSVHIDSEDRLWVLDPGNPKFEGVVEGAPKLVRFDLPSRAPAQVIRFAEPVITKASYLNDVRVDVGKNVAYITDSGDGALVVVDLDKGTSRRVLSGHASVVAADITLTIGGKPFDRKVHADGIALDTATDTLYYQPLTSRALYRISAAHLRDETKSNEQLAAAVEKVADSGASDGLWFFDGRVWISSLEKDAIVTVRPGEAPSNVISDPRIAWPDSFSVNNGTVYFTTAQIHLGDAPADPFRVWRLKIDG